MPTAPPFQRRHDLDWLRASAFLVLILYHVGMFFVPWGWHISNPESAGPGLQVPMFLVAQWRLPLLFLVSGAAVHFSLRRRTVGAFARERITRLLLPLVFGILVVVPPQVYYERLTQGAGYTSYLAYLPDSLSGGPYPEGNLSWHHLWFVFYVLVYALAALPLLEALRTERGRRVMARMGEWFGRRGRIYLFAVPLAASEATLRPSWPSTHTFVGDWANVASYFLIFLGGYLLYSASALGESIERQRRTSLSLAMLGSAVLLIFRQAGAMPAPAYTPDFLAASALRAGNTFFWLLALVGYASRYLRRGGPLLRHVNEAVYPFYILHQTVIIAVAYHLMDWRVGVPLKFTAIAAATLVATTALHLAIRTNPVSRVLFGMKPWPPARGEK
jgi:glucans biosynthesis protein C